MCSFFVLNHKTLQNHKWSLNKICINQKCEIKKIFENVKVGSKMFMKLLRVLCFYLYFNKTKLSSNKKRLNCTSILLLSSIKHYNKQEFCVAQAKVFCYLVAALTLGKKWVHPGCRERHQQSYGQRQWFKNVAVNEQENTFTATHG